MIQLDPKHLAIIQSILKQYPYTFYAFGSRAKQTAKPFSDLDLCYKEAIPDAIISQLEADFEESDLPFKVELINWHRCDAAFQKMIEKDFIKFSLL